MTERPKVPGWVAWVMKRFLTPDDRRVALSELAELHEAWGAEHGRREADRRYRRQLRQYPLRLLLDRLPLPGRGAGAWLAVPSFRQAVRSLARSPVLTVAIVLTVGLGIGGCVTVFAIVDALYLRPLAYDEPDRLGWIYTDYPPNQFPFSVADYQALEAGQTSFGRVGAARFQTGTLLSADEPERVFYMAPTPSFFDVLGIRPVSGRLPSAEEGMDGGRPTLLTTLGFAQRRLGALRTDASDRLGTALDVDGVTYTLVGVLPDALGPLVRNSEIFPTLRLAPPPRRGPFFLRVVGRLRPGVSEEIARQELRRLYAQLLPEWGETYRDGQATWGIRPVEGVMRGDVAALVGLLMGAVGLLLVIAVVNAVGLLLTRVGARRRELAVRTALGATGSQIAGHLLVESSLLAGAGVGLGILAAVAVLGVLPMIAGDYIPRLEEARVGGTVLGFTALLALGCAGLFTMVPSFAGVGSGARSALSGLSRDRREGRAQQRGQRVLIVGQLAVTMPLLAAAGLLLSSFVRLQQVDPGFESAGLLTLRVSVSRARHPEPGARMALWRSLEEAVAGLPGVSSVGLASARPPATHSGNTNNFDLEDRPTPEGENEPLAHWASADVGYFEALGIALVDGRLFTPDEEESGAPVIVVDEAWARRWFPGESAVGRRLHEGGSAGLTTVVGVVEEVPYMGPGVETGGTVYAPWLALETDPYLVVRTRGAAAALTRPVREEVGRIDPTAPVTGVQTGDALLSASLAEPRHLAIILGAFAVVALLLAVVGLYGITAQRVQRQRPDIAVRLALGGQRGTVLAEVLRDGLALAMLGLAVGVMLTVPSARTLEGMLYEVAPLDPLSLASAILLLLTVATVATLVPAARALGVDPASTLREE